MTAGEHRCSAPVAADVSVGPEGYKFDSAAAPELASAGHSVVGSSGNFAGVVVFLVW